jgi:hypothetical protein
MCVSLGSELKCALPKCTLCAPKEQLPAREKMVHDDTERPHIESGMRSDGAFHQVYPIRLDALDNFLISANSRLIIQVSLIILLWGIYLAQLIVLLLHDFLNQLGTAFFVVFYFLLAIDARF